MSSGWQRPNRLRFDLSQSALNRSAQNQSPHSEGPYSASATGSSLADDPLSEQLHEAVDRTSGWLIGQQDEAGFWVGELEGDSILESEYVLLLAFLGRGGSDRASQAANYLLETQLSSGGWAIYPGGPLELSASVKAYFALKITGHDPQADYMIRARAAILEVGGAERVNSFTRYYLALLGVISYNQCPAVPPELMLIPRWMPLNLYEMSAWSRTIVVPLSLLWAHRPVTRLPEEAGIRELFVTSPEQLAPGMEPSAVVDAPTQKTWLDWGKLFRRVDRVLKLVERMRFKPLRKLAVRRAAQWMLKRFERSDGLGAIFPPIVWSTVALKCLGYSDESPEVRGCLEELEKLTIVDGNTARLQPCKSPVWDTALSTIALREAGVATNHPAIRKAVDWMLSQEIRAKGDWAVLNRDQEPSGWCFEFNNEFYPDVDDTSMVLMALCRSLPATKNGGWSAEFLLGDWSPHEADRDAAAVVSARSSSPQEALADLDTMTGQLTAIWRGARWILAMQGRDGGFGAFDPNNNREIFTKVPFADHNAMIDPSTADLTARMLEMFADLKLPLDHPNVQRAVDFVWNEQDADQAWYGRWGVNFIYGTWQALVGLTSVGVATDDRRIRKAADWLRSKQQECGGWGESPASYDDPRFRGQGPATASQTAWALMGLMAAGEVDSPAVHRGLQYLLQTQNDDGTWDEPWFTGTGFPRVFYLKYHLYRVYFPLMALARFGKRHRVF